MEDKAVIINTPAQSYGKGSVASRVGFDRDLCQDYDSYAITDEIYEHILYDGHEHVSIGSSWNGGSNNTISGFSKTVA